MLRTFLAYIDCAYRALRDSKGVTALEYGILAGVLAVGIIAAGTVLSTDLNTAFGSVGTGVTTQTSTLGGSTAPTSP